MPGFEVPKAFARTVTDVHGEQGVAWLRTVPALLEACQARWDLAIDAPFALSYHYVAPAVQADGTRVVLKLGVPGEDLHTEIAALQHFDGQGSVRLLASDTEAGALLLERLEPGTSLERVADDEAATRIAARVMQRLWKPVPPPHPFPSVAEWADGLHRMRRAFGGTTGPLPARLVEEAEALCRAFLATEGEPALLHGDLHQGNILRAMRTPWLAIDPKGVVGEAAFEAGAFMLNPRPQSGQVLARRVAVFAEVLGVDRERLRGWGLVRAVWAAWWSVEDHGTGWEDAIQVAERLAVLPAS